MVAEIFVLKQTTVIRKNDFLPTRISRELGLVKSSLLVGSDKVLPSISKPPCLIRRSASEVDGTNSRVESNRDHFSCLVDKPLGSMLLTSLPSNRNWMAKCVGFGLMTISDMDVGAWRSRKTCWKFSAALSAASSP